MTTPDRVVRSFLECMEARHWPGARALVADDAVIDYTATGERFRGAAFVAMNEAYPEGWTIEIVDVVAAGDRVAAQIRVAQPDGVDWCAGFYTVADGLIRGGTEHWVRERAEPAPAWRVPFTVPG